MPSARIAPGSASGSTKRSVRSGLSRW